MPDETQHRPRILISITSTQSEKLLKKCFDALRIPIFYQCRAQGTAPSEILDILGMRESARLITVSFLPRFSVPAVFEAMENELSVKRRGGGIVFTVPVTGIQTPIFSMLNEEAKEKNRTEGRAEGQTHFLLLVLDLRGAVPDWLKERIRCEKDPRLLEDWMKAAADAVSVEDFLSRTGLKESV